MLQIVQWVKVPALIHDLCYNKGMSPSSEKIATVFEMLAYAEHALRTRLRTERSEITDAELRQAVRDWYMTRPGAEFGDCSGDVRVGSWEERMKRRRG